MSFEVVSSLKKDVCPALGLFPIVLFFSQICLYCFPSLFSIQEISLQLSHALICFSCCLQRHILDCLCSALHFSAMPFHELAACSTTLAVSQRSSTVNGTILDLSCLLLVSHCHSDLIAVLLQVPGLLAGAILQFTAWVRVGGCAQRKSTWGF